MNQVPQIKKCYNPNCGVHPITEFYKCKKKKDGLNIYCKACIKLIQKNLYIKPYQEPIKPVEPNHCKLCGKNTNPIGTSKKRYHIYCSTKCSANSKLTRNKCKETNLKKYGVENVMQSLIITGQLASPFKQKKVQEKAQATIFKNHGTKYPLQNKEVYKKLIQTNLQKYGCENTFQNKKLQEKGKQTCFERYGVERVMQNIEIIKKQQKSAYRSKPYILPSGKIVNLQGYEPQFLNYIFKNNILKEDEIDYSPKGIKYIRIDNTPHYYFPDFYIPKWNLIIEIKSDWTMKLDTNIYLKEEATRQLNYKYICILNNDFTIFTRNYLSNGSISLATPKRSLPSLVNP